MISTSNSAVLASSRSMPESGGDIGTGISELDEALREAGQAMAVLEERLSPALCPSYAGDAAKSAGAPEPVRSLYGQRLNDIVGQVRRLVSHARHLANSVQL